MLFKHFGQKEFGRTIDLERGSLYMQTFKKLPMHKPNAKINNVSKGFNVLYKLFIVLFQKK
jgi:hypothetical protein